MSAQRRWPRSDMTPATYRANLARLGLSQVGAARFLGIDARTSRRYASGERPIPPPVARLLALADMLDADGWRLDGIMCAWGGDG